MFTLKFCKKLGKPGNYFEKTSGNPDTLMASFLSRGKTTLAKTIPAIQNVEVLL